MLVAILGFNVLVVTGVLSLLVAYSAFAITAMFGWLGAIGCFLLWLACEYGPFHLTMVGG